MRALILSAGLGTRLRPITYTIPKCLIEFKGRPLLDIWLKKLIDSNILSICINTHYISSKVKDYIETSKYSSHVTLCNEEVLLGTAGTLFANIGFYDCDSIILIHGDNLSIFSMNDFVDAHQKRPKSCEMTMMLFRSDAPKGCGIVELDSKGVVINYTEKPTHPKSNLANAAVYIIEKSLILELHENYPEAKDFSEELIPKLMGRIFTYENNLYHRDIGTIESLRIATEDYESNYKSWSLYL